MVVARLFNCISLDINVGQSHSPMVALHGFVPHRPHRAKHLHHRHQTQPFSDRVDSRSVAQRGLKRHTRFARQHSLCVRTVEREQFENVVNRSRMFPTPVRGEYGPYAPGSSLPVAISLCRNSAKAL